MAEIDYKQNSSFEYNPNINLITFENDIFKYHIFDFIHDNCKEKYEIKHYGGDFIKVNYLDKFKNTEIIKDIYSAGLNDIISNFVETNKSDEVKRIEQFDIELALDQ